MLQKLRFVFPFDQGFLIFRKFSLERCNISFSEKCSCLLFFVRFLVRKAAAKSFKKDESTSKNNKLPIIFSAPEKISIKQQVQVFLQLTLNFQKNVFARDLPCFSRIVKKQRCPMIFNL